MFMSYLEIDAYDFESLNKYVERRSSRFNLLSSYKYLVVPIKVSQGWELLTADLVKM